MHLFHRVAHSIWEVGIEQQEFGYCRWFQIGRIDLAIRLECRTTGEQRDPIEIIGARRHRELRIEKPGKTGSSLNVFADLNEMPAFAMIHRRISHSLEAVCAFSKYIDETKRIRIAIVLL